MHRTKTHNRYNVSKIERRVYDTQQEEFFFILTRKVFGKRFTKKNRFYIFYLIIIIIYFSFLPINRPKVNLFRQDLENCISVTNSTFEPVRVTSWIASGIYQSKEVVTNTSMLIKDNRLSIVPVLRTLDTVQAIWRKDLINWTPLCSINMQGSLLDITDDSLDPVIQLDEFQNDYERRVECIQFK